MYWIHSNSLLIVYQQYYYRVWQKNLTIWPYSSEQNHWCGDVSLEGTSSMTQGISVIMEHWLPSHLPCGDLFQKQQFSCCDDFFSTSTSLLFAILYCCGWQRNVRETSSATKKKNLQEDSLLLELLRLWSVLGCHKPLAFSKRKYPCIKYVWSYSAPNIASSLKFSSLKNGWFKHSIIETT